MDVLPDWKRHLGKKTAMEKMNAMIDAIEEFCAGGPGKDALKNDILKIWKGFVADGEAAEPLAAELAKALGKAPELRTIQRCNMHSQQKNMKNALLSDPDVSRFLEPLISYI